MKDLKNQKLGAGLLVVLIIQLVMFLFSLPGTFNFLYNPEAFNKIFRENGLPEVPVSFMAIGAFFTCLMILGITLMLLKKNIGIYIYFTGVLINIVSSQIFNGFHIVAFLQQLLFPVLTFIFLYMKRDIFFKNIKK